MTDRKKHGVTFWASVALVTVGLVALFLLFTAPWLYVGHTSW